MKPLPKKRTVMDDGINKPWAKLLNSLEFYEASAFLAKLHKVHVKARQRIFHQGECDNRLIFIESGHFKLSYWDKLKKKNIVFTRLSKGSICGAETFFNLSPHTFNLAAIEDSIIRCLYKKDYQKLLSENPAFENTFIKYCEKLQKKIIFHDPQELGRRAHKRLPASLKGLIQQLDSSGKILPQKLRVTVSNLSIGGLRCSAQNLSIGDAVKFYKSKVDIKISYQKDSIPCDIQKIAKVVSVRFLLFGESTIHLQFQVPLTEKKVVEMAQSDNIYIYS